MQFAGDAMWHAAVLQPGWQEEDVVKRNLGCTIKSVTEFGLKRAELGNRTARETRDEEVGFLNGKFNGAGPVLARHQLAAVEPGVDTSGFEAVAEAVDEFAVFGGIGDEDARLAGRGEIEACHGCRREDAEAVNMDGAPFIETLSEQPGEKLDRRRLRGFHHPPSHWPGHGLPFAGPTI